MGGISIKKGDLTPGRALAAPQPTPIIVPKTTKSQIAKTFQDSPATIPSIAPSQNTIYLHDVLHVTVSATGQVTSAFTDVTFTCRR